MRNSWRDMQVSLSVVTIPLTKHRLTNRKEAGALYTPVGHYDLRRPYICNKYCCGPLPIIPPPPFVLSFFFPHFALGNLKGRPSTQHKVASSLCPLSPSYIQVPWDPWLHYFAPVNDRSQHLCTLTVIDAENMIPPYGVGPERGYWLNEI